MVAEFRSSLSGLLRRSDLFWRIHVEAFRCAPWAYLTALKWRVLRKRVRSRAQFARLLGQTSLGYEWHTQVLGSPSLPSPPGHPPIVALVAGEADAPDTRHTLASLSAEHLSWHLIGADAAAGLARAAAAIDWTTSPWLMPIQAGDCLAPGAASTYRCAISKTLEARVIYADDDLVDDFGQRRSPHFKPEWNRELYRYHDYLTGSSILRIDKGWLEAITGQAGWATALVARALEPEGRATRIAQVLHHRRTRPEPSRFLPPLSIGSPLPRASIIVPTRNRVDLLSTCIAGIECTAYPDMEVIVVDNDSDDPRTLEYLSALSTRSRSGLRVRVVAHPGPFNYSTINNRAVLEASGEFICLLNNDIEMLAPDWLAIMVTQGLREDVGAVGAQLLYPDGRLQHAGVVIGVGNAAGHAHRFLRPEEEGYFRRHALPQFVTAVTAACLVVRRDRFLAIGGLDERAFPVAFNDVDLCLRLNARGWQSFYEPRAVLVHHESVSRGFDRDPVGAARFAGELAALQNRWGTMEVFDPYHHPRLSRASEQFALAL
jgi:O-antigen biosynthesis protein